MAENIKTLITTDIKLPKIAYHLTDLQKEIYQHLESNGPQTALKIAKAIKKKTASDVNSDLYAMKDMNLLEKISKDWRIKAMAPMDVEGPSTRGSMSGTELASKAIQLTELQKNIITFVTLNKSSKAVSIAKGVGKNVAKDVNSHLYAMKKLNLLCLDEKEKLWSVKTGLPHTVSGSPNCSLDDSTVNQSHIEIDGGTFPVEQDTRRDSGIDVEGPSTRGSMSGTELASKAIQLTELRLPHTISGSPNCSLEDSTVNQSHIEIDGGKFSDEQDSRRDSGIGVTSPCYYNYMGDEPKPTAPPAGETSPQHESQMMSTPQYVIKNYSFTIQGCHSFTIGDTTWPTQGHTEPIREGNISIHHEYRDTDITAQEAGLNQDSAFGHSEDSIDDSLSEPILPHTLEDEVLFTAPCTSSPGPSSYHELTINISDICDGLGNVTIDDQNNGEI